jgi:hypothetical protein
VGNWISFSILWMLTGNPVAAGIILLAAYAITDWYTFGFLRGIARLAANWQRGRSLQDLLLQNPHDRKARADLGETLLEQRRFARAIEVVKPVTATPRSTVSDGIRKLTGSWRGERAGAVR